VKARRVVLVAIAAVLMAVQARAVPIYGDPITIYLLKVVARILSTIQQIELTAQRVIQARIDLVLSGYAFPGSVMSDIREAIDHVQGIRNEVEALSCDWRFSARTGLLRDLYLRRFKLCRPSFQLVWGSGDTHWDQDLQELQDYVATLSANTISERVDAETSWRRVFPGMDVATGLLRKSPGEAIRDEAVALAGAGVVADSNSTMASQSLLLAQLQREMERFEDRKGKDMGELILLSVKGDDPLHWPPERE
jgi:hypothetical protein